MTCLAQVDLVPGSGHYPFLEQPLGFVEKFREQLRQYMTK